MRSFYLSLLLPCLLFTLIAPMTPFFDLKISSYFYRHNLGFDINHPIYQLFYTYGEWPAFIICFVSAIFFIISCFTNSLKSLQKPALLLFLTLVVGAGIIINILLKDHWGRARPRQVTVFGGKWPYTPFYQPDFKNHSDTKKSFPSGHAAMGFYFFTFTRLGIRRKNKAMLIGGLLGVFILGGGLSLCRIAMGGHFFSDILASALIMWITTLLLERLLCIEEKSYERTYKKTT